MKIRVSPGFLLLVVVLFYLDEGIGFLPWGIAAAVLHEGGHVFAGIIFGGRAEVLALSIAGAELRITYPKTIPYWKDNLISLAGPITNLLFGLLALWCRLYLFSATSLGLGIFNLMPILPLDGGRVLYNFISERSNPDTADHIMPIVAGILIGLLTGFSVVLLVKYANALLLILSLWLLLGILRKKNIFFENN